MRKWLILDVSEASKHPLYGIKGVASVFKVTSVLFPLIGFISSINFLSDIVKVREVVLLDWLLVFFPYAIIFIWAGYNAELLQKHKKAFFTSFYTSLAVCPIISVSSQLVWALNQPAKLDTETIAIAVLSIFLAWALWALIWIPYFLFSKRINLTLLNRLKAEI